MTWSKNQPGKRLDLDFEYLGKRAAAVEPGRTKLRGCIMLAEVPMPLRPQAIPEAQEQDEPPANCGTSGACAQAALDGTHYAYSYASSCIMGSVDTGRWNRDMAGTGGSVRK